MRKVVFESELDTAEIIQRVQAVTENFHTGKTGYLFEGKIAEAEFKILPTFDYGPRNQLRPEITGLVKSVNNKNLIELQFGLPNGLKLLFCAALLINAVVVVYLYLHPQPHFFPWQLFAGGLVVTAGIFYFVFQLKIKKSIAVVSKIIQVNIQN